MKFSKLSVIALLVASHAFADDKELYYAADKTFSEPRNLELRVAGGFDFSNPYLNVRQLQLGAYWLASPYFAFGLEGAMYDTGLRSSAQNLQQELAKHGSRLEVLAPKNTVNAAIR